MGRGLHSVSHRRLLVACDDWRAGTDRVVLVATRSREDIIDHWLVVAPHSRLMNI